MAADTVLIAPMHTAGRNFASDLIGHGLIGGSGCGISSAEVGLITTPYLLMKYHINLHLVLIPKLVSGHLVLIPKLVSGNLVLFP